MTREATRVLIQEILAEIGISSIDQIPGSTMGGASVFAREVDQRERIARSHNTNHLAWYNDDINNARRVWRQRRVESPVVDLPLLEKVVDVDYDQRTYRVVYGPEHVIEPPPVLPWDEPAEEAPPPPPPPGTIQVGDEIRPGWGWGYLALETNVSPGYIHNINGKDHRFQPGSDMIAPVWMPVE